MINIQNPRGKTTPFGAQTSEGTSSKRDVEAAPVVAAGAGVGSWVRKKMQDVLPF